MQSRALIIVAHGSRKESSNAEVAQLTQKVKAMLGTEYMLVKTAFLEFAEPSLEEGIIDCVQEGAKELVILPYFLASGNHVTRDIPEVVEKMQKEYPEVRLELKAHIGSASGMVTLLGDMAVSEKKL